MSILKSIICAFIFFSVHTLILKFVNRFEKETQIRCSKKISILFSIINGGFMLYIHGKYSFWILICLSLLLANLFTMVLMDIQYTEIYDLFHYISCLCLILMLPVFGFRDNWGGLVFFILIQAFLFSRMYGHADVIVFCLCGVFLYFQGKMAIDYFWFMGLAFLINTIVQFFRGNIGKDGNMKVPMPLTPYILIAFVCFI